MLKTSSTKSAEPRKNVVGIGGDSRARRDRDRLDGSGMNNIEIDDGKVGGNEVEKKDSKSFKSKKKESGFFTSGARMAFTKLRQAFIKTLILHHFDPKHHIQVKTDTSGYGIGGIFSQLTLDNLGQ